METCPACSSPVPESARFCPNCGQRIAPRGDERRIATVLFADVAGFTSLSEDLDPEHVKNLIDSCFQRLAEVVESFGGVVDKIIGDAIVALFGAPIAHEDDAERAVRAALTMQREVERHSESTSRKLAIRIGINTGEVLVGSLRAGGDYTAMGDAINVAARLESEAAPGEVLVGESTYLATRDSIEYEKKGSLTVKGRSAAVSTWRALRPILLPGIRPAKFEATLVGRDVELGLLENLFSASVARSTTNLAVVVGEAGVGKTRLAQEFAARVSREFGASVLEGRCLPYGEANVWWPLADALRRALGIGPADPPETVRERCLASARELIPDRPGEAERIAGGLANLMGQEKSGVFESGPAGEQAITAARSYLRALAQVRPVVLILAEVHWADRAILDFVDDLVDKVSDTPLMVIVLAREELRESWNPRAGRHSLLVLSLDPLDETAAVAVMRELIGADVPHDLAAFLYDRSGGNPFYLQELVALLIETGVVSVSGDRVHVDATKEFREMPATLRGLVSARLDALSDRERALVDDASVVGRTGEIGLVEQLVSTRGIEDAREIFDGLESKGVFELDDKDYEFRSDLVREVSYQTLTKGDRARKHAQVADLLSDRVKNSEREYEYIESLAHHSRVAARLASELGEPESGELTSAAVDWTLRAAEGAAKREWPSDAERLFGEATSMTSDAARKTRALLGRGRARTALHDTEGAREDASMALKLAEETGNPSGVADAWTVMGCAARVEGDLTEASQILERAVRLWHEVGDESGEADARREWAMACLFAGEHERSRELLSEALDLFGRLEDKRGVAWALQNLAWTSFMVGDIARAEEYANRSAEAFRESGDVGGIGWALGLMAWIRFAQGRRLEARDLAQIVLSQIEEARQDQPWAIGMMTVLLAQVAVSFGKCREAIRLSETAMENFESIDDDWGRFQSRIPKSQALLWSGQIDAALRDVQEAIAIAERLSDPRVQATGNALASGVALSLGDPETALANVERGYRLIDRDDDALAGSELRVTEGGSQILLGNVEEGVRILEETKGAFANFNQMGFALLALGLTTIGRASEGLDVARQALTVDGWSYSTAWAEVSAAFAHVRLGDVEGAVSAFDRAAAHLDADESLLASALAELARSIGLTALDSSGASEARNAAKVMLDRLDFDGGAWVSAYRAAAGIADEGEAFPSTRRGGSLQTPTAESGDGRTGRAD